MCTHRTGFCAKNVLHQISRDVPPSAPLPCFHFTPYISGDFLTPVPEVSQLLSAFLATDALLRPPGETCSVGAGRLIPVIILQRVCLLLSCRW